VAADQPPSPILPLLEGGGARVVRMQKLGWLTPKWPHATYGGGWLALVSLLLLTAR